MGTREAMTRAGVLAASYKFKVLSLDQPGDKFMVMMDLAKGFGRSPGQLAEMEALIVQNANRAIYYEYLEKYLQDIRKITN